MAEQSIGELSSNIVARSGDALALSMQPERLRMLARTARDDAAFWDRLRRKALQDATTYEARAKQRLGDADHYDALAKTTSEKINAEFKDVLA